VPYVPLEDVDTSILERSDTQTHCPFKGDASYWSLRVGERALPYALWAYEQPIEPARWLEGLAALAWDAPDAWYVEEDRAFGPHLRDPYHRVGPGGDAAVARLVDVLGAYSEQLLDRLGMRTRRVRGRTLESACDCASVWMRSRRGTSAGMRRACYQPSMMRRSRGHQEASRERAV